MCPLDPAELAPPYARFDVSRELAEQYMGLFVNRDAYCIQAERSMMNGKVNWYLARTLAGVDAQGEKIWERKKLNLDTVCAHITGEQTINLYAINPETQRSKWLAIDADYPAALPDLVKLQSELRSDGIEAALEQSRRGGHLWLFAATPLLAKQCRIYIYNLALRLGLRVKGGGLKEGLEIFPLQDTVKELELGNAIRGPLGVHRRTKRRYWFFGADWNPEAQMRYLLKLPKITETQMEELTLGMTLPEAYQPEPAPLVIERPRQAYRPGNFQPFVILDHVRGQRMRKSGRNYWTQCPSCAQRNGDKSRDNLAILISDPNYYKCWAGCSSDDIRNALGQPKPKRYLA